MVDCVGLSCEVLSEEDDSELDVVLEGIAITKKKLFFLYEKKVVHVV